MRMFHRELRLLINQYGRANFFFTRLYEKESSTRFSSLHESTGNGISKRTIYLTYTAEMNNECDFSLLTSQSNMTAVIDEEPEV